MEVRKKGRNGRTKSDKYCDKSRVKEERALLFYSIDEVYLFIRDNLKSYH
jgi:hypothetical protein